MSVVRRLLGHNLCHAAEQQGAWGGEQVVDVVAARCFVAAETQGLTNDDLERESR
jgi:hypothetical protein